MLFNLLGWIWKKTRRLNLICILLTAASWLILGIFYGFGYCPPTDRHFNIPGKLGYTGLPDSNLSFLFTRLTGLQAEQSLVDALTLWGLVAALIISPYMNFRNRFKSAKRRKGQGSAPLDV